MSNLDLRYQRLGHPTDKIVKIILNQCKRKFSSNENFSFYIAYQRLGHPTDKIVTILLNQCKRKFSNNEIFSFYIA